jgi:DNA-3-methyladenine glycosylase II
MTRRARHLESDGMSAVRAQLARILSLDVDGSGFARLAEDDPVVAELIAAYPGLRRFFLEDPLAAPWQVVDYLAEQVGIGDTSLVKGTAADRPPRRGPGAGK